MHCKGAIQAPLTLSINGFTESPNTSYGAFTLQSGFTGKQKGPLQTQELLGINTSRTHLTINFQGYHFPDVGPKTPIIGMDYFSKQSESDHFSIPQHVDFRNSCIRFQQPKISKLMTWDWHRFLHSAPLGYRRFMMYYSAYLQTCVYHQVVKLTSG